MLIMHQVVLRPPIPLKFRPFCRHFKRSSRRILPYCIRCRRERCTGTALGSEETRAGARNRVANARRLLQRLIFGWRLKLALMTTAPSLGGDRKHQPARRSAFGNFAVPAVILEKVREGEALGPVMSPIPVLMRLVVRKGRSACLPPETYPRQRLSPGGDPGAESVSNAVYQ